MKDAFIGRHLLGRYRISKLIGRGGMSMVYLAEQQIGGVARPVAIKILDQHSTTDPQIVERFRRESETVVRLRHPNTVEIYDTGELDDGTMFFVMEYIEGESLSSVIRKGAVSVERGDRILLQIGSSLYDAHQMGIVHRDLKPANVIVTTRGLQRDFVKVLDFGLAKTNWDGERLTGSDRLLGTPAYMSPEQFTHAEVDVRSDVYALGVVAYQIMSGRLPFQAKGPWEWATKHLNDSPEPLGTLPNGEKLHPRKASAIMRALSKKPEERQQTVLEFLRDYTGYKDIGDAWAQATAGAGSAPPSSIAPPSMPPRLEFGTLDTDGKRAVAGLPAGLSGRPHVPVAPPAAPGAATPQSGDPGRVRARTILGMFPPASAGNLNAPNVPPPPPRGPRFGAARAPAASAGQRGAASTAPGGAPVALTLPASALPYGRFPWRASAAHGVASAAPPDPAVVTRRRPSMDFSHRRSPSARLRTLAVLWANRRAFLDGAGAGAGAFASASAGTVRGPSVAAADTKTSRGTTTAGRASSSRPTALRGRRGDPRHRMRVRLLERARPCVR
ncbi:MAG: serine/threonine-protein kinase [Polyangiales bacterium]